MSKPERQKNAKEAIETVNVVILEPFDRHTWHFLEYDVHAPAVGCAGVTIC